MQYQEFFEEQEDIFIEYEVAENPKVVLNYREKNYYNLKKSNKQKKKAKK